MKEEDIVVLSQILAAMKNSVAKLENAKKMKKREKFEEAKKEILNYKKKIDEII